MPNKLNLTGQTFARLTAIRFAEMRGPNSLWLFACSCGTEKVIDASSVKNGRTKSCGCQKIEAAKIPKVVKHGYARVGKIERLFNVWRGMKNRCANRHQWRDRGIKVCKEWLHDYPAFRKWALANGFADGLTIDREGNDGDYEPSNCRWVTQKVQSRNTRRNRILNFNGKSQPLSVWAEEYDIAPRRLWSRLSQLGWTMERALVSP